MENMEKIVKMIDSFIVLKFNICFKYTIGLSGVCCVVLGSCRPNVVSTINVDFSPLSLCHVYFSPRKGCHMPMSYALCYF